MTNHWRATGPRYERSWGGRPWTLAVDEARPGLMAGGGQLGPLLALDGLSARDRSAPDALGGVSLVAHEARIDGIEALYAP